MMFGFFRKKRIEQYCEGALQYFEKRKDDILIEMAFVKPKRQAPAILYSDPEDDEETTRYSLSLDDDKTEAPSPQKKDTEGGRGQIRYSRKPTGERVELSSEDMSRLRACFANTLKRKITFVDKLLSYSREKNMSSAAIYRAAGIDRRLYSKIISDRYYKPSKDTAIAIALALHLDLKQTTELLGLAGYTLSNWNKRDVIIEYFINERIYKLVYINEVLYCLDQKIIGR